MPPALGHVLDPYKNRLADPVVVATLIRITEQRRDNQADQQGPYDPGQRLHGGSVHALDLHAEDAVPNGVSGDADKKHLHCSKDNQVRRGVRFEEEQRNQHRDSPVDQQGTHPSDDPCDGPLSAFGAAQALARPFLVT